MQLQCLGLLVFPLWQNAINLLDITDIKPLYDNYHFVFIPGNHDESLFADYFISIFVKIIRIVRNSLFSLDVTRSLGSWCHHVGMCCHNQSYILCSSCIAPGDNFVMIWRNKNKADLV